MYLRKLGFSGTLKGTTRFIDLPVRFNKVKGNSAIPFDCCRGYCSLTQVAVSTGDSLSSSYLILLVYFYGGSNSLSNLARQPNNHLSSLFGCYHFPLSSLDK